MPDAKPSQSFFRQCCWCRLFHRRLCYRALCRIVTGVWQSGSAWTMVFGIVAVSRGRACPLGLALCDGFSALNGVYCPRSVSWSCAPFYPDGIRCAGGALIVAKTDLMVLMPTLKLRLLVPSYLESRDGHMPAKAPLSPTRRSRLSFSGISRLARKFFFASVFCGLSRTGRYVLLERCQVGAASAEIPWRVFHRNCAVLFCVFRAGRGVHAIRRRRNDRRVEVRRGRIRARVVVDSGSMNGYSPSLMLVCTR